MKKVVIAAVLAVFSMQVHAEKTDIELVGTQGSHYFFTLSKPWIFDASYVENSAKNFCSLRTVCIAHFWEKGTASAKSLPMTDAQVAAELATYQWNKNTGRSSMLWRCGKYPESTSSNCFSD